MQIKITGLDDLLKSLRGMHAKQAIDKGITKSLMVLEREAKLETPVDT